jgi:hypothetical protein
MLFAACPAYCSNTYYVATNGSDSNAGTITAPFKTITKAVGLAQLAAGDTIYVRGGTHGYTSTISISKSGTSVSPITLQNYQNEAVIVDFTGQAYGSRGISLSGSYWHLKGFTIQYAGDNGLYITGNHNVAEQMVTRMNSDSGTQLHGSGSYNLVLNCDSYLNYDSDNNGEDADGFAVKSDTIGPGNIFRGCRSWHNADDGFDLYYSKTVIRFEDCWSFRNGIDFWGGPPPWNGDGNGFKLGDSAGNHVLIRCLAYDTYHNGIDINGDTLPVEVYNCTAVNCRTKNFQFDEAVASVLRNNISHQGSVNIDAAVDDQNNSWNGFTVTDADFASLDANGIDGPRGPNGELPKLAFLRLAATSALIDAGIDVNEPFNGSAPDLGAFEYIAGDCEPDWDVDFLDLKCLADNWLDMDCGTCNGADFSGDNKVNFDDFAIMAENWMK